MDPIGKHDRPLKDQLRRAAQSVALNLAESTGHQSGNRRLRLESALGSTYETRACLHIAARWGYVDVDRAHHAIGLTDSIAAITYRLLNPSR